VRVLTSRLDPVPVILDAVLDSRGRKRSPAAIKGFRPSKPPATKGRRFPPDPLPVEDVVALLNHCTPLRPGCNAEWSAIRLRALIVLLWRTGLRISEALALEERDLSARDRTIVVRRGKGGKRRLTVMDEWGWPELERWLVVRRQLPPGQVFCVLSGVTCGRAMQDSDVRRQMAELAKRAGVRRRVHCHGFRHTHAVDLYREGVDLLALNAQLGHARLDVTQIYLRSLADVEVLAPIAERKPPMMHIPPP
jgi:integrase